jgi:hypothetical protein
MAKPHQYTGVLATPISSVEWDYYRREAITERLDALFRDFGMKPAHDSISLFRLMLKLAERHVNGFRHEGGDVEPDVVEIPRRRGRKPSYKDVDLVFAVLAEGGRSERAAAKRVANSRRIYSGNGVAAFVKRYQREKAKFRPYEIAAIKEGIAERKAKN